MDVPFRSRIYALVRAIPAGRVMTYGTVAAALDRPRSARAVGSALSALPDDHDVPWWRVVASDGRISTPTIHHTARIQRALLEDEGVRFDDRDRIDRARYGWDPDPAEVRRALLPERRRPELD